MSAERGGLTDEMRGRLEATLRVGGKGADPEKYTGIRWGELAALLDHIAALTAERDALVAAVKAAMDYPNIDIMRACRWCHRVPGRCIEGCPGIALAAIVAGQDGGAT